MYYGCRSRVNYCSWITILPACALLLPNYFSIMAQYQLVEKHTIEHHNEYYEVRSTQNDDQPKSLFFTTNDENLEDVATAVVADHMPGVKHWTVVPHRKDN